MNNGDVRRAPALIAASGAAAFLLALVAWAFASPVGATPDEDFHLVSTWCGGGLRDGACEAGTDATNRTVRADLVEAPCYAFQTEASAGCQGTTPSDDDHRLEISARGNFAGDYPPVFFLFTSLFAGDDIPYSVLVMRVANATLFVLMMAATYFASPPSLRRPLLAGLAVTLVPLGIFLIPSVNPSSWAILSAATLMVTVLGYMRTDPVRRRVILGALAGLALLFGAGSRADAAMYAVIAIVAALMLTVRRERSVLRRAIYPVVLAIVGGLAYLSAGQSSAVAGGPGGSFSLSRFAGVLIDVPDLWVGALGRWGLGWLDTAMPAFVWVSASAVFFGSIYLALAPMRRRQGLALAMVGLAAWLVPAYVQYLSGAPVGAFVQPRYVLPLMTVFAVTAFVRLDGPAVPLSTPQRWFVVVALSMANSVALHYNMRRYLTGFDVAGLNLDAGREWWWDVPFSPMVVWALGSIAFGTAMVLLSTALARSARTTESDVVMDTVRDGELIADGAPATEFTGGAPAVPTSESSAG